MLPVVLFAYGQPTSLIFSTLAVLALAGLALHAGVHRLWLWLGVSLCVLRSLIAAPPSPVWLALTTERLLCATVDVRQLERQEAVAPMPASVTLTVRVTSPASGDDALLAGVLVRLRWYTPPDWVQRLARGDRVWVRARVRPIRRPTNQSGQNTEARLYAAGLRIEGRVLGGFPSAVVAQESLVDRALHGSVDRLRESASAFLVRARHREWLQAVLLGQRSALARDQWQLLSRTGTVHLLVVSGLHVGIVSALGWLVGRSVARVLPWLRDPSTLGLGCAIVASGLFVAVSGFGVPAQRAWLMAAAAAYGHRSGRPATAVAALAVAAFVVLLLDPLAALSHGFWLSFSAVAVLLFWFGPRRRSRSLWRTLCEAQAIVAIGLLPLLLALDLPVSVSGPLANLVAVPLVSWLIVPAGLLALALSAVAPVLAESVLKLVDAGVGVLLFWLHKVETLELSAAHALSLPPLAVVLFVGFVLLPNLGWARWQRAGAGFALALVLLPRDAVVAMGEFQVNVFDVGQGDAVLVRTREHRLLFDTGAPGFLGPSRTEAIILPAFKRLGVEALDALVISHDDADHAGGEAQILSAISVRWHLRSRTGSDTGRAFACRRGMRWSWDGVRFEFLAPIVPGGGSNADSCVLLVSNATGSARLLLPGDIDRATEHRLEWHDQKGELLLLAPHHGSRTSSSSAFVRRLAPSIVVFSASRFSRFGHPHSTVVERYRRVGARLVSTGVHGELRWYSAKPAELHSERCATLAWQRPPAWDCANVVGHRGGAGRQENSRRASTPE
ncbi:MAG: DNA internalization-related competence protein ComEC/Rec2 [Pseudomonadota bacterium]